MTFDDADLQGASQMNAFFDVIAHRPKRFILWGLLENESENHGDKSLQYFASKGDMLVESDSDKWGSFYCGLPVCSPEILKTIRKSEYAIVLLSQNNEAYSYYLENLGMIRKVDYFLYDFNEELKEEALKQGILNSCLITHAKPKINKIIDVVIPIYDAFEYTNRCIESVLDETDVDYNLYLMDDCSTDKRFEKLFSEIKSAESDYLHEVHIEKNQCNLGFIKTVNKGIKLGENDVVILNTQHFTTFRRQTIAL